MKPLSALTFAQTILASVALLSLPGCSTRVEYFVDTPYPARGQDAHVEWLSSEPSRPYIKLAHITVSGSLLSQDVLRHRILDRARELGADASPSHSSHNCFGARRP